MNDSLKIISFDMEGTLATPDFSNAVWHEGVPYLYAQKYGIGLDEASKIVMAQYDEVGDQRPEWYDIKYWFSRFGLGDHRPLMESYRSKISYYAEAKDVIEYFARRYNVIIVSSSTREFLPYLLDGFQALLRVFSSISDYGSLKTPSFYLGICQELGIEPGEMAHIGDNFHFDYLNPREVGIQAFYLDRKQNTGHPEALKSLLELERIYFA